MTRTRAVKKGSEEEEEEEEEGLEGAVAGKGFNLLLCS